MKTTRHIALASLSVALVFAAWPAAAQQIGPWRGASPIAGGIAHVLGLKSDGHIVAWGYNSYGQTNVPVPNADFVAVAAGYFHSLGLKSDGRIVAWGSNSNGQLLVPGVNVDFVAVAAGAYFSLGLKSDGSIVAWGNNSSGQTSVPAPNADFVAVAAGDYHALGLKSDGSIVAWGNSTYSQTNVPAPNADFTTMAGGYVHSLGLKSDGSIVAWKWNDSGQTNVPAPNTGFAAVAAGFNYSLGLKSDGRIIGWGTNNYGQINVPAPNADFVAAAGAPYFGLGLKSDGRIIAWGSETNVPAPNAGFGQQSGVMPSRGITDGGTTVNILGAYLGNGTDVTNVTLCGVAATIVTQNPWRVVVQTRPATGPTNGDVVVYSAGYGSILRANAFTYFADTFTTNGTSQAWMDSYGLTNDVTDADSDGMREWEEYIAGTDPTNRKSLLVITNAQMTAGADFVLRWPSVSNRIYAVGRTTNLLIPGFAQAATNLPATPPVNVHTDAVPGLNNAAYRIQVTAH